MKETELGELIILWLKENRPKWEIFQEIRVGDMGSPIADIVCIDPVDKVWVIELKTSLNLTVIRQAYSWDVDYRSVAVPQPKQRPSRDERKWWYRYLEQDMRIGTLEATNFGTVREKHKPPFRDTLSIRKSKLLEICRSGLTEGYASAGGAKGGHWTPYKESIKKVKEYIKKNPGCMAADIIKALGKLHYSSEHSARTNLVKNLQDFNLNPWCEIKKRGTYLTFYFKEEQ